MRILFLTSRFPFPLEKGDKLRAFYQLKELSRHHQIILAAVSDRKVSAEHIDALKPFCSKIIIHELSMLNVFFNLVKTFFTGLPFQVGYFYSKVFKRKIDEIISSEHPHAIYCQLVRMAEYVKDEKQIPKTLDYMDAFSKGLERLAQRSSFLKKIAVTMEWKRMKKYEEKIFKHFEQHTIISEQDKKLIPHPENESLHVVPNGVDMQYYSPLVREKKYDLIFSGNMNYPPNIESALYMANEIMPLLLKKKPDAKLVIAGADPSSAILKLKSETIHVTGWVDDIRECFAESRIHLAPMLISIGLQNKILQAMAMKIPCIVSSLANNAIHAPTNDCLLIANSPEEYVEKILMLLHDEKYSSELAEHAHRFVQENFNWSTYSKQLERIMLQNRKISD
jgi:sugar transferase (PEP-CTERM/EpsH1 system associated)